MSLDTKALMENKTKINLIKPGGLTRRRFIRNFALATVPWIVPSGVLGRRDKVAPSNRIAIGCIGTGYMGTQNVRSFMGFNDVQIVAVCDVAQDRRERARKIVDEYYSSRSLTGAYKGCAAYNDFRELLARPDIDAVAICSPDHWHAVQAVLSAKAGKDIYCEKPMAYTIQQSRAVVEAVERYGRVFQHGTWRRSRHNVRFACELVRNEKIGNLETMKVGSKGGKFGGSAQPMPVPAGFDWDMWLGPAPQVPYSVDRWAGQFDIGWYYISDYSIGWIAGWGIHPIDMAQWGNDTDYTAPIEVKGTGTIPQDGLFDNPYQWDIHCKYANGVDMHFASVAEKNWDFRNAENSPGVINRLGVVFEGSEGWVYAGCYGELDAYPKTLLNTTIKPNEIRLYQSNDHFRNFIDCVKTRRETVAPVEVAHQSNIVTQLCYLSTLLGRKLKWNPTHERFVDDNVANRLLSRSMRSPWHL